LVGLSEQILHVGSYNNDSKSFEEMKEFVMNNKLERASLQHKEIYPSDAGKVETAN
jgi:hypothetical protein